MNAQHGGILSHLLRPVTRFTNLREHGEALRVRRKSLKSFSRVRHEDGFNEEHAV